MNSYYPPGDPVPPPEYSSSAAGQKSAGLKTDRPRETSPKSMGEGRPGRTSSARHARIVFWRIMEGLSIALSFLYRSRIARFLTTKVSMDLVVEVTVLFGRDAGRRVSTIFAFLAAEPALIAVIVTVLILILELILWIIRRIFRPRRRKRQAH